MIRGMAFANFAKDSLLAKNLREKGFSSEAASEEADKDFGDGVVGHFDCGHVYFRRGEDVCSLYQSRFSDSWAIEKNGYRPPLVAFLADLKKMNDEGFVGKLLAELEL